MWAAYYRFQPFALQAFTTHYHANFNCGCPTTTYGNANTVHLFNDFQGLRHGNHCSSTIPIEEL